MSQAPARMEIITDDDAFYALRSEWDALWTRLDGEHHQSFDVCWLAWTMIAKPRGKLLRCLVAREDGKLVMVWPMVAHTKMRCTLLRPLGPATADYTVLLMAERPDQQALLERAWHAHVRFSRPDLSYLPYLRESTALHTFAARQPRIVVQEADRAALATLRDERDWPSFCRSVGALDGRKPGALERRLGKEGKLALRVMGQGNESREELSQAVEWTLAQKREWASRAGRDGPWLHSSHYRDYLVRLLEPRDGVSRALLFWITLDGEPIATSVVGVGQSRLIGLVNGFDLSQARFGPGKLSIELVIKWAFEQRLDVDFGVGVEKYKAYWTRDRWVPLWSYEYTNTRWGWTARQAKKSARELVARISQLRAGAEPPGGPDAPEESGKDRVSTAAG